MIFRTNRLDVIAWTPSKEMSLFARRLVYFQDAKRSRERPWLLLCDRLSNRIRHMDMLLIRAASTTKPMSP